MSIAPGTRFGVYEIVAPLGSGGMGDVYRARDTELRRDVALKFLPASVTTDADRVARFRREAQMLAALNHPHIAQIYGLGAADAAQFLVLELVDGESLDKRIARDPIPIDEALGIAAQVVDALEAAHDRAIVHRDLKPANIALTRGGEVKVLDFGLAKAVEAAPGSPDASNSPTLTSPAMTAAGVIIGTAAYMSPEQAKARAADRRSDIWAFGCVVFEMLTGRRTFAAGDVAETLARVLTKDPEWDALPAATPLPVRRLLRRCLEKDPRRRLDSAAAARLEIEDALSNRSDAVVTRRKSPLALLAAVAASALALWIVGTLVLRTGQPPGAPALRFAIVPSPGQQLTAYPGRSNLAISPDGRYLVYPSVAGLLVRWLDQLDPQIIPGTQGASSPFVSPDGRWIGFFQRGDLKKVAASGGSLMTVSQGLVAPVDGSWADDDTIVFSSEVGPLSRVSASGGRPEALMQPDTAQRFRDPFVLPGAGAVLFTVGTSTEEAAEIAVLNLKSGLVKSVLRGGVDAAYAGTGISCTGRPAICSRCPSIWCDSKWRASRVASSMRTSAATRPAGAMPCPARAHSPFFRAIRAALSSGSIEAAARPRSRRPRARTLW